MKVQVFFAGYGDMEGQLWANAQMLTDFISEDGRAGCQVGKINIVTDNNNAIARRLVGELQRAKEPIFVEIEVGSKTQAGKIVSVIKDFKLVDNKTPLRTGATV
jgi:hypothetical protein